MPNFVFEMPNSRHQDLHQDARLKVLDAKLYSPPLVLESTNSLNNNLSLTLPIIDITLYLHPCIHLIIHLFSLIHLYGQVTESPVTTVPLKLLNELA